MLLNDLLGLQLTTYRALDRPFKLSEKFASCDAISLLEELLRDVSPAKRVQLLAVARKLVSHTLQLFDITDRPFVDINRAPQMLGDEIERELWEFMKANQVPESGRVAQAVTEFSIERDQQHGFLKFLRVSKCDFDDETSW